MPVFMCEYPHEYNTHQKSKETVVAPGAGITGSCELLKVELYFNFVFSKFKSWHVVKTIVYPMGPREHGFQIKSVTRIN